MADLVLQLKCQCNNYPWGKQGEDSLAAKLCAKTPGTDFTIDESKNYAEMWMGTYPVLPSFVLSTGEELQKVLDREEEKYIGKTVLQKFGHANIMFLPKVLSIAKALPLQLHPDKYMANRLHQRDPDQFTDPNHKPEIAIALSDFEAFVGFKPLSQLEKLIHLEPLKRFLPTVQKPKFDDQTLKHVVGEILKADDEVIAETQAQLSKLPAEALGKDSYILEMIPRLQKQYDKTDPGIIVALVTMNYMQLKPGDSLYIPADSMHAYLSGDIIECMARSNNVLNTGFCPRAERNAVEMFTSCLTFTPHDALESLLPPESFSKSKKGKTKVYAPPMSEFDMAFLQLGKDEEESWEAIGGPSIFVCTKGSGMLKAQGKEFDVKEGYVFFVGHGVQMDWSSEGELEVFNAFVE
ncbi:mannose-6-phosphate isomeras-like protein [Aulographum hederae CBS 113979]|uniref:Mannose-6-phosphate isomerase n=1 Tax=Aulographum hederae CBS 113979 TaxID=1176131 RepID=A0A6G1H752_9PEZI|nr:mannose-6-phosphate isomeras-like protein [Aulographum hederae CBS 113979]